MPSLQAVDEKKKTKKIGDGSQPGQPEEGSRKNKRARFEQIDPSERIKGASLLGLKRVPFDDLKLGPIIGRGRNGSLFKAKWRDQEVALKQFDLDKGGDEAYHREVAAYARLQDAWGQLTPQPLFVSESSSGGIMFLAMELARDAPGSVYYSEQWSSILRLLEEDYGIQNRGIDALIITRNGKDHLVAADFDCVF